MKMVYLCLTPLECLIPKPRLRHMARSVVWPPYPQNIQGTDVDPTVRANLLVAHWKAFANRLLRNYTRKYMFKFWKIEKRHRA